jgi:hypothetical protein
MIWIQYVLLFGAGVLLSLGAYLNRARGFASIMVLFVWLVVGFASVAVQLRAPGTGTEYVYSSVALQWLCYANAAMHFVTLLLALHTAYEGTEDDADDLDPALLTDRLDNQLTDS